MRNEVFDNDTNSAALIKLIKDRQITVFIGSGLSNINGLYPSWRELVNKLCDACNVPDHVEITDQSSPSDLQKLAGLAREMDEQAYVKTIEQEFAKTIQSMPRSYHFLIRAPFKSYITINFDPLLAEAMQDHCKDGNFCIHAFPQFSSKALSDQGGVFYLHGYVPQGGPVDVKNIVLTEDDFKIAYSDQHEKLSLIWRLLLLEHAILFIGCRLGEPEFQILFSQCTAIQRARDVRHGIKPKPRFILLARENETYSGESAAEQMRRNKEKEEEDNKNYSEFGIIVIRYDPKDKNHSGLIEILGEWAPSFKPIVYKEQPLDYN